MSTYDSIEDLHRSLHLLSKEQLEGLRGKLEEILEKHEEAQRPEEAEYEQTPLEEFEFCDDLSAMAALADELDGRGFHDAADELDALLAKTAAKKKKQGRSFAQWVRKLKKMQAPQKAVDRFRKAYKGALEQAKKRKNYNADRAEEYAMRTAIDGLPKKYLKEPTKFHGSKKRGPIQDARDAISERREELSELIDKFDEGSGKSQEADDATELAARLNLDINKLRRLTPQQLQTVKRIQNPGLARQWAEQYARQPAAQQPAAQQPAAPRPQPMRQPQPAQRPPAQPAQQPAPQPAAQPAPQPAAQQQRRFDLNQWERNMGFQGQQQPGPGEITDADMAGTEITEETLRQPQRGEFPAAPQRGEFPAAATRQDLYGRR